MRDCHVPSGLASSGSLQVVRVVACSVQNNQDLFDGKVESIRVMSQLKPLSYL